MRPTIPFSLPFFIYRFRGITDILSSFVSLWKFSFLMAGFSIIFMIESGWFLV